MNTFNLCSVLPLEDKSSSLMRIHFAEKLLDNYKERNDNPKSKIAADALLFAIKEQGYATAYCATVPTEENVKRKITNRAPTFFGEPESESEIMQDMEEEARVYKNNRDRSYDAYYLLTGYFDRQMADLYNSLYSQLSVAFEQTAKKHDDWSNYSLA